MTPESFVPFDHAARFELTGRPGNVIQDVINISAEGVFVAVAIGYGLEEERGRPLTIDGITQATDPGTITLEQIGASALIEGFRVNPELQRLVFALEDPLAGRSRGAVPEPALLRQLVPPGFLAAPTTAPRAGDQFLFERLRPPQELSFLFNIVDSSSGRELQDEPIHNLASLGKSNGERPFRLLAQPATFLPRSTIRLQIVERSEDVTGTLFMVLYGYKILAPGCSESAIRDLIRPRSPRASGGARGSHAIPFDYVTTFRLTGRPGTMLEDEISINVEAGFIANAIGYGLEAGARKVGIDPGTTQPDFDLGARQLQHLPTSALQDGIRIRPEFVRLAFASGNQLARVPVSLATEIFERVHGADDVSFRYTIFDSGRGIELQNQPIHNIAGLGAADGGRPFKKLFRPLVCLPRSTLRVRVEEHSGRGTLFIVFHGFKRLHGAAGGPS